MVDNCKGFDNATGQCKHYNEPCPVPPAVRNIFGTMEACAPVLAKLRIEE